MISVDVLRAKIVNSDWDGLYQLFGKMSNSDFRRAESVVRESIMPELDGSVFWQAYLHLLKYRHQAFITCILGASAIVKSGSLDFSSDDAHAVAAFLNQISPTASRKVMDMLLPMLVSIEQMEEVFRLFAVDDEKSRVVHLIKITSPLAYYMLFLALRHSGDRGLALRCCMALQKKKDDLSCNMASIVSQYFGLDDVKIPLTLKLKPYEHSYLEASYDNFVHLLTGRRPRI